MLVSLPPRMDVTTLVEPFAHDRTEIERLVDLAKVRVINGKTIPKPIKNAETPYHPDILKLLYEFADVFTDNLPLGLPVPRETDHSIDLVEHEKHLPLITRGRDRTQETAGGLSPGWPD